MAESAAIDENEIEPSNEGGQPEIHVQAIPVDRPKFKGPDKNAIGRQNVANYIWNMINDFEEDRRKVNKFIQYNGDDDFEAKRNASEQTTLLSSLYNTGDQVLRLSARYFPEIQVDSICTCKHHVDNHRDKNSAIPGKCQSCNNCLKYQLDIIMAVSTIVFAIPPPEENRRPRQITTGRKAS